jgi:hypothetical protein
MKSFVSLIVLAASVAAIATAANARPHHPRQVCVWHHHHRVCTWVH